MALTVIILPAAQAQKKPAAKKPSSPSSSSAAKKTTASAAKKTTASAAKKSSTSSKGKSRKSRKAVPRGQMAPTAERIRQIQGALAAGGHYHQEPTGRMDAATVAALTSFQQANGLEPSGKLTAQTLIKLEQHGLPRSSRPSAEQGGASSSDK